MNILVISPHGMYRDYTFSFIHNQNKAFVRQGHRVRVIVPVAIAKRGHDGRRFGPMLEWVTKDGVEICFVRYLSLSRWGAYHFNHYSAAWTVAMLSRRILRDFKPDVIHANAVDHGGMIGAALKKRLGIPLSITTHGGDTTHYISHGRGAWLRTICDQADALASASFSLLHNYDIIGTAVPCTCIINGFEVQSVKNLPKQPHHIIQVGMLVPLKHNDYTIRAVARLKAHFPDITLTIVGDGGERARLESLCAELQLQDTVRFTGMLPNPEAMAEMATAQIFVMPSYPEGLGIVYLEAMASGCVAIGTEGEGISGVITSGKDGFLVARDDVDGIVLVITKCFEDEALMQQIAENGRKRVQSLTWDYNAAQYIDLFRTIIEKW